MTNEKKTEIADALLDDIKNELNMSWATDEMEKKIFGWISTGINLLVRTAGDSINFYRPGTAEYKSDEGVSVYGLLVSYCMYEASGLSNEFKDNYREDLMNLAIDAHEIEADEDEKKDS